MGLTSKISRRFFLGRMGVAGALAAAPAAGLHPDGADTGDRLAWSLADDIARFA